MTEDSGFVSGGLAKVLNVHGHAFQYAVLRRGEELYEGRLSDWAFEAGLSMRGVCSPQFGER